jgi:oxygen-independent coproporphyrinogen-3 oxidase
VERVLMGLRTDEGVAVEELAPLSLQNLPDLMARGMLRAQSDRLVATPAGRAVLDRVTGELAI